MIRVREELGRELLDAGACEPSPWPIIRSRTSTCADAALIPQVKALVEALPGVERVLDEEGKRELGLDHPRSGELVAIAHADSWFTYYYFLDDARAPDFARTVDIHRKPGYDPVELFLDPALRLPKLRIASRLAQKTLGMRYLMDVISLDATLVKGSHGRPTDRPGDGPLFITSEPRPAAGRARCRHRREAPHARSRVRRSAQQLARGRMTPAELLQHWLQRQLRRPTRAWLDSQCALLRRHPRDRELYLAISLVSRKLGKDDLRLDAGDLETGARGAPGLGSARLERRPGRPDSAAARAQRRVATSSRAGSISCARPPTWANWSRSIAACRCIPISRASAARGRGRALQHEGGVRGGGASQSVSRAKQLPEAAWNQMVLKALVRRQRAASDSGWTSAAIRHLRACCATMRTNDGRRGGR